jgi:hypothetical protein
MRRQEGFSQVFTRRVFQRGPIHLDQGHQERTICNLARTDGGIGSKALAQGDSDRQRPPERTRRPSPVDPIPDAKRTHRACLAAKLTTYLQHWSMLENIW